MKNVLFKSGACQGMADARWKRLWDHRLAYSGSFWLIPAYSGYSGLFVDTAHASDSEAMTNCDTEL